MFKVKSHLKSVVKAFSWRAVGAFDSFFLSAALAYCSTGHFSLKAAGAFVGAELFTKTTLYYFHERAWAVKWVEEKFA